MNKKEEFKAFASKKPELVAKINNGETTWQKLYEMYDIYGENESVWEEMAKKTPKGTESITNMIKNINMDNLQGTINNAQKALSIISEFTSKGSDNINSIPKGPETPRPINKFFGD